MSRRLIPIVLVIAAVLRIWGIGFGLPLANGRPDETALAGPAVAILLGDFRPPDFMYPSFFYYALAFIYLVFYWVSKPFLGFASIAAFAESRRQSLAPFFYVSRGVSVVMGTLTVWWVYAIGRRVFDATVGVTAALFLAVSFLHVRESHFGVTDTTMTALIVLAVLTIIRWREGGGAGRAALAGLVCGLATSTKYNGLGAGVPFVVAAIQRVVEARESRGREARRVLLATAIFGAAFVVAFLGTSPYALVMPDIFLRDVTVQGTRLVAGHGVVLSVGWVHYARLTLPAGLGWPIWIAGAAGTVLLVLTRLRQSAVLLAFPVAYFLVAGRGHTVFARHILPVVPFVAIAAAWLVVTVVRALVPARRPRLRAVVVTLAVLAMAAPTAWNSAVLDRLFTEVDSRAIVARALVDVIPPGSTLYHSGGTYGQIPFEIDGRQIDVHLLGYDESRHQFTPEGAGDPDWIILQRSPLVLYSHVPRRVEGVVRERYELVQSVRTADHRPGRVYDQQDAFFLPLVGLAGVERPGPEFEVYRRRAR